MTFTGQSTLNKEAHREGLIQIWRWEVGQMWEIWQVVAYMGLEPKWEDWVEEKIQFSDATEAMRTEATPYGECEVEN